jgi:5-methylcytosine-specific restriction endonuclease McrA
MTMAALPRPKPMVVERRERRAAQAALIRTVRAAVWRRDQHRCRVCGRRTRLQVHHVQLRSHGGPWTTANCVLLCRDCHQEVHARIVIISGRDADVQDGLTFERQRWW